MWVRACILFPCISSNKRLTHYPPTLTTHVSILATPSPLHPTFYPRNAPSALCVLHLPCAQQILSEPSLYALFLGAWTAEIRKAKKKNPKNAQLEAFRATCMSVWPALCVPVDIGGGTRAPHHGMSALGATTAFFEESTLDGDGSGAAMTPRGHHSVGREVAMQPFNVREMAMDQPFMAHTAQTL